MSEAQARRPQRRRLGNELRRLREFTGMTQRELAQIIGTNQTAVDRIEKGGLKGGPEGGVEGKPPAWPKVEAWALACQSARPDMDDLWALTMAAVDEHNLFRNMPGLAAEQEEVRLEEEAAATQLLFNPWGIPGLLQTADYSRHVFQLADFRERGGIAEAVEARQRRQGILDDESHRFEFILTEAGLRWRPGPLGVLADQLAHLAGEAARPTVTLSVIPLGVLAYAIPRAGFVLYEDLSDGEEPFVAIEIDHKRATADKAEDVDIYRAQFALLRRSAIHGTEAVEFIREVERSL